MLTYTSDRAFVHVCICIALTSMTPRTLHAMPTCICTAMYLLAQVLPSMMLRMRCTLQTQPPGAPHPPLHTPEHSSTLPSSSRACHPTHASLCKMGACQRALWAWAACEWGLCVRVGAVRVRSPMLSGCGAYSSSCVGLGGGACAFGCGYARGRGESMRWLAWVLICTVALLVWAWMCTMALSMWLVGVGFDLYRGVVGVGYKLRHGLVEVGFDPKHGLPGVMVLALMKPALVKGWLNYGQHGHDRAVPSAWCRCSDLHNGLPGMGSHVLVGCSQMTCARSHMQTDAPGYPKPYADRCSRVSKAICRPMLLGIQSLCNGMWPETRPCKSHRATKTNHIAPPNLITLCHQNSSHCATKLYRTVPPNLITLCHQNSSQCATKLYHTVSPKLIILCHQI